MNGVHDMGGQHGMGPVEYEKDEPVFHSAWEGRVYAMTRAMLAWRKWTLDAVRHGIEVLPPVDYLRMSYYERWLTRLERDVVKYGFVTQEERQSGHAAPGSPKATPVFTIASSAPSMRVELLATEANASLISTRDTSAVVRPACSSARAPALAGVRAR